MKKIKSRSSGLKTQIGGIRKPHFTFPFAMFNSADKIA